MDAPVYPPADTFVQPVRQPHFMSAAGSSIAELQAHPAAWAIAQEELPGAAMITRTPQMKVHLGNMSLASLTQYTPGLSPDFTRLDARLRALGEVR